MKKVIPFLFVCFLMAALAPTPASAQLVKTSLRVTVLNELGNPQENATVKLYLNEDDYKQSANPVATEKTDEKGRATFKELESKAYFVEAEKGDMNNYGLGTKTDKLVEKRMNKVNVVIE
ncbi:hypothetical protein SAMN05421823_10230 [Catalinimonas alkaloidigena]|uniref:SMCHD1 Ig-like domain-containing protein n=1 Tax=Catalinimonas alkaloidigena TaxID=1075417 RepID=A0A1G8ZMD3_9BACT|nr:carboxypeptidase regulatory-like domain-containing protein [Catalinimonas alkaloidigena]SDK16208.1 hypothetical protein SAMN05421823_10230 [Catalinimonas alkaloidigena]